MQRKGENLVGSIKINTENFATYKDVENKEERPKKVNVKRWIGQREYETGVNRSTENTNEN